MKVGIISYPMLFQSDGGLKIHILQTIAYLRKKGIDVSLVNPLSEKLEDYDLIHLFSAINGNYRVAQHLNAIKKPMVISPLLQPYWNRNLGQNARLLEKIVYRVSRWTIKTEYYQIHEALKTSKVLFSLSAREKNNLVQAFDINPDIIFTAPNGLEDNFFGADPGPFRKHFSIFEPYVLQVSAVDEHKNPLTTALACKDLGYTFVLIGPVAHANQPYLDKLLKFDHVRYVGPMTHINPLLPSAYAGADAFCLPSLSEVSPLVTIESLASGTPVALTRNHAMDFGDEKKFVVEVDPNSVSEVSRALRNLIELKVDRKTCSSTVERLRWGNTVDTIIKGYQLAVSTA